MLVAVGKAKEEVATNSCTRAQIGRPQVAKEGVTVVKAQATRSAADQPEKAKEKESHKVVVRRTDLKSGSHGTWICPRSSAITATRWVTLRRIVQSLTSGRSRQIWRSRKTNVQVF